MQRDVGHVRHSRVGGGLEARNKQAERDALRRRQKAKKARIVKRHVRYKDKKKLLATLEAETSAKPIVAHELRRYEEEESDVEAAAAAAMGHGMGEHGVVESHSDRMSADVQDEKEEVGAVAKSGSERDEEEDQVGEAEPVERKKAYVPFQKEMKQFEAMKQERERRDAEVQREIEERNSRLKNASKARKDKVCLLHCEATASRTDLEPFHAASTHDLISNTC